MGQLHFFAMLTIRNIKVDPNIIVPGKMGVEQVFTKIDELKF